MMLCTCMFIPKRKTKKHHLSSWFNSDIHHRINASELYVKNYKGTPSLYIQAKIKSLEVTLKETMKMAKSAFETNLINSFPHDVSRIYKYIRKATGHKIPAIVSYNSVSVTQRG